MNEIESLCDCTPYLYILRAVEGLVLHTPLRLGRVVVIVFTVISSPFPENHFQSERKTRHPTLDLSEAYLAVPCQS